MANSSKNPWLIIVLALSAGLVIVIVIFSVWAVTRSGNRRVRSSSLSLEHNRDLQDAEGHSAPNASSGVGDHETTFGRHRRGQVEGILTPAASARAYSRGRQPNRLSCIPTARRNAISEGSRRRAPTWLPRSFWRWHLASILKQHESSSSERLITTTKSTRLNVSTARFPNDPHLSGWDPSGNTVTPPAHRPAFSNNVLSLLGKTKLNSTGALHKAIGSPVSPGSKPIAVPTISAPTLSPRSRHRMMSKYQSLGTAVDGTAPTTSMMDTYQPIPTVPPTPPAIRAFRNGTEELPATTYQPQPLQSQEQLLASKKKTASSPNDSARDTNTLQVPKPPPKKRNPSIARRQPASAPPPTTNTSAPTRKPSPSPLRLQKESTPSQPSPLHSAFSPLQARVYVPGAVVGAVASSSLAPGRRRSVEPGVGSCVQVAGGGGGWIGIALGSPRDPAQSGAQMAPLPLAGRDVEKARVGGNLEAAEDLEGAGEKREREMSGFAPHPGTKWVG